VIRQFVLLRCSRRKGPVFPGSGGGRTPICRRSTTSPALTKLSACRNRKRKAPCASWLANKASSVVFHPVVQKTEEHTSALQSRENLVCHRLLETKKRPRPLLRIMCSAPQPPAPKRHRHPRD